MNRAFYDVRRTMADRSRAEELVEAAATRIVAHGEPGVEPTYELAGAEFWKLEAILERLPPSSQLTNALQREKDATERACFLIGLAVGRRLGPRDTV